MTTPSRQRRPFSSISIQPNTLRENYAPFGGASAGLYRTDGTYPELVENITVPSGPQWSPAFGPSIGGQLLLKPSGNFGQDYYRFDGASLTEILPSDPTQQLKSVSYSRSVNGSLLFFANNGTDSSYYRLTPAGLSKLPFLNAGDPSFDNSSPIPITATGPYGQELYRTDGQSLQLIADINAGPGDSSPGFYGGLYKFGGYYYFDAYTSQHGFEFYRTDVQTAAEVADINPGTFGAEPKYFTAIGNRLVFMPGVPTALAGNFTFGTAQVQLLANINPTDGSDPSYFRKFGNFVLFEASPGSSFSPHLYRTDGVTVSEVPGITSPDFGFSTEFNGQLYSAAIGPQGAGIYRTDGQTVQFLPGSTLTGGAAAYPHAEFHQFAGQLLVNFDGPTGRELYHWDGKTFSLLAEIYPGSGVVDHTFLQFSSNPRNFFDFGDDVYFTASDSSGTSVHKLSVISPPGDYNHDGIVDTADYTVWRDSVGQSGSGLAADGDGSGIVDIADYEFWKSQFGSTSGSGVGSTGGSVPEPNVAVLLTAVVFSLAARRSLRAITRS